MAFLEIVVLGQWPW